MPNVLYHYTDAAGLLGIVERAALWATHARFLNDVSEIVHGVELLKQAFKQHGLSAGGRLESVYFSRLVAKIDEGLDGPIWISSFSELDDDLSQWRAYSPHGGYAIGFDTSTLKQRLDACGFRLLACSYRGTAASYGRAVHSVGLRMETFEDRRSRNFYRENERRAAAGETQLTEDSYLDQPENHPPAHPQEQSRPWREVYWEAATFKHSTFEAEHEWRAVRVDDLDFSDCRFRVRGASLIPYVEIPIGAEALPITSITTSPGLDPKTSDALKLFTSRYTARLPSIAVKSSSSPYTTA